MPGVDPIQVHTVDRLLGIQLAVDPADLPPGALADAVNVELATPYGAVGVRPGSISLPKWNSDPNGGHQLAPLGNSDFAFTAAVLRLILDSVNRNLWALVRETGGTDTDTVHVFRCDLTQVRPGFDDGSEGFAIDKGRIPGCAVHGGRLYVATGTVEENDNRVIQLTGAAAAVGTAVIRQPIFAPTATTAANSAGITGEYRYAYSFLDSASGSRGALKYIEDPVVIPADTPSAVTITCTGTTSSTVDKIEIWRTTDQGSRFRYLATVDNPTFPTATIDYVDTTRDDKLSYRQAPVRFGRVPTCRYCLTHNDRLLWAVRTEPGIDLNVLYYSEPYYPLTVDPVFNVVSINPDDGDQVTGLARLYNRAFVFKTRQIYELVDNRPDSVYRVAPIVNEGAIGCVAHATIVEIEGNLFFLCRQGVALFNGESARLVSGPIEAALAEIQVEQTAIDGEIGPGPEGEGFRFSFRNGDVVREVFHFEVAFFRGLGVDPNTDGVDQATEVLHTQSQPGRFLVDGQPFPVDGVLIRSGRQVLVHAFPVTLTETWRYYVWTRAWDGTQFTDWVTQGPWDYKPQDPGRLDLNWGLVEKFFAIDYWPAHEYWLFVASGPSKQIDVKYVLDYRTIDSEQGPVWRRELIHATACALVDGIAFDEERGNLNVPVMGDGLGLVWAGRLGTIDHHISRQVELTWEQRVGTATIHYMPGVPDDLWAVTAAGSWLPEWPTAPGLEGERVVVRDRINGTYTGVIVKNKTPSTGSFLVGLWLEGRVPPLDSVVEIAIGGIDAHFDPYLGALDDPDHTKQCKYLILRGYGAGEELTLELRLSDQSEFQRDPAAFTRMSRSVMYDVMCGGPQTRLSLRGRGRFIGLRLGSWRPNHRWRLASFAFGYLPTAARR